MLAITATTTPKTTETGMAVSRVAVSAELDRAERGETEEQEETVNETGEESGGTIQETGFEHVVVAVGVVETIKALWDDTTPLVRRFR